MHPRSLLLLGLMACGGKILEDPSASTRVATPADPGGSTAPGAPSAPSASTTTGAAPPADVTVSDDGTSDACTTLCDRDERCPTTLPAIPSTISGGGDCIARCHQRLAGKCGADAWLLCFAARIEPNACTKLPDECRDAYCGWARCAKQPVASCE